MLPLLWPGKRSESVKATSHPLVAVPDILINMLAHLEPWEAALCLTVCKSWHPLAQTRLYANVKVDSKSGLERCHAMLANESERARISQVLRGISITRSSAILFPDLASLAPALRALTICSGACIGSADFAMVLPSLSALTSLTLINADFRAVANPLSTIQGTSQALAAFASARDACAALGLTVLRIINSPDLTSEGLQEFMATGGSSLIELELSGCVGINEGTLKDVARHCSALRHLTMRGVFASCRGENDPNAARHALAALAIGCRRLVSLTLNKFPDNATWSNGDAQILSAFAELKHLVKVDLTSLPWLTADDLGFIAAQASTVRLSHLSALRSLPLLPHVRCLMITGIMLSRLSIGVLYQLCENSPHLRKLVLDWTDVTPALVARQSRRRASTADLPPTSSLPASFASYEHLGIFDEELPSELVAEALSKATCLEHVALFGFAAGRRLGFVDVQKLERACPNLIRVH